MSDIGPILSAVTDAIRKHGDRPVLVAVDGRGGAGKLTLAAELARRLTDVALLHTDDFAFGWEGGWDLRRFDLQVLQPLLNDRLARYQRYDWNSDSLAEWHEVHSPVAVLILEGVSSTRKELRDVWDIAVWVDAPESLRLQRGLTRDGEQARELWRRWMAEEDVWISEEAPIEHVDFIIDGTSSY